MSDKIVRDGLSVIAAVTNRRKYAKIRKKIDWLAEKHGLIVTDLPGAVKAMDDYPDVRNAVRQKHLAPARQKQLDLVTFECYGMRNGKPSYEVWHGAGSMATKSGMISGLQNMSYLRILDDLNGRYLEGLVNGRILAREYLAVRHGREYADRAIEYVKKADILKSRDYLRIAGKCGFMRIDKNEWDEVGKGRYAGQDVPRLSLEDARMGNVPEPGTPHTISLDVENGDYSINDINEITKLDRDAFMRDDRILMLTGSPENREMLAGMYFGPEENGGEGLKSVSAYHLIHHLGFDSVAVGSPIRLGSGSDGIYNYTPINNKGRFLAIRNERPAETSLEVLVQDESLIRK